jgi:hypothetical protein
MTSRDAFSAFHFVKKSLRQKELCTPQKRRFPVFLSTLLTACREQC